MSTVQPSHERSPSTRTLLALVLAFAATALALWLWIRFCQFPAVPWNDLRLAPTIALARGLSPYSTVDAGTVSTWMYGPLPFLAYLPAALGPTAADALMIAAALNLALTLLPLALVCWLWPVAESGPQGTNRAVAFLLGMAVWPELHYSVIFSDNLAVLLGLLGNLLLVRSHGRWAQWAAAGAAAAAMGSKQIALGIPLAQVAWLAFSCGRRAAVVHLGRIAVTGAALGLGAIATFGWEPLRFMLLELPANLPWAPDGLARLRATAPFLAVHLGVPLLVALAGRRRPEFWRGAAALGWCSWICCLPLGLAGCFRIGGWTNSLHGFVLWLPPMLVTLLVASSRSRWRGWIPLAAALAATALLCTRIALEREPSLRPKVQAHREAARLAQRHPQGIWFPLHPLVTLYSDRRFYHDEDGLYARSVARRSPSADHLAHGLPPRLRFMAFHSDWNDWGIARSFLPPGTRKRTAGHWILEEGLTTDPPR